MGIDDAKKKSEVAKGILCTKEKIEETQKKILKVVELLLEDSVPPSTLIKACENLSQADYSDVIEERNILTLCGYPLCSKKIQVSKQKYHISCKLNKVYDISERKCFCSNECYKASKFLKVQLSEEPVWLQEVPVIVSLLSESMNKGSAGEEVNIEVKRISKQDIHLEENVAPYSHNSQGMLLDEIRECTSQLKNLVVKETTSSLENTYGDGVSSQPEYSSISANKVHTQKGYPYVSKSPTIIPESRYSESEILDSDDDEDFDDDRIFPRFENEHLPIHKNMPVVSKPKFQTTVLIEPLPKKVVPSVAATKNHVSLDFIQVVLQQWVTRKSLQFLYSKKNIEPDQCVDLGVDEWDDERISRLQNEYINLCVKLEKQEAEETDIHDKYVKEQSDESASAVLSLNKEAEEHESLAYKEKVAVYFKGEIAASKPPVQNSSKQKTSQKKGKRKQTKPAKTVTFSSDTKEERTEAVIKEKGSLLEPVLPVVDSLSQDALRLQIVVERLRVVYLHLLPLVGLHYKNISDDVRLLLSTFKFSANNITFRPYEWKLVALVLFRMLMTESFIPCEESMFLELVEKSSLKGNCSVPEIDAVIDTLKKKYKTVNRIVNMK